VDGALAQLEREGFLESKGRRKGREIVACDRRSQVPLRIAIFDFDPPADRAPYISQAHHRLLDAGHTAFFTDRTMSELGMNLDRIVKMVRKTEADAWVVVGGAREFLEWMAAQDRPVFALFGRRRGLPIAGIGPDQPTTARTIVRKLTELGHRRIVMLTRPSRILPVPGATERAFLDELTRHDIEPGQFNLPVWKETVDGLREQVKELLRFTPPTAILIDEPAIFLAVQQQLMQLGCRIPGDLSLVCSDGSPSFRWLHPSVAHVSWNSEPWVRRITQWAGHISLGKTDLRQSLTKARFIGGGTIGPAAAG
jgi:DNA-binding LacI/PurR family transcriptional regulator